ncbi:GNAT family N-acetyltransferase [Chloroflexota bacterium]|nr:GNAT family N-acetyltransferase [Chloroflexota bacterium]
MIIIAKARPEDVEKLTETQIRAFIDDNKNKPPNCSLEGPPGYNSLKWNLHWIQHTHYYKILFDGQLVGGLILFDLGESHFEVGRIWIDPKYQNKGIGQDAMCKMFKLHSDVTRWTLGTPSWAIRNQHFYEALGFVKIRETEVDPDLGWSGIEYERKL